MKVLIVIDSHVFKTTDNKYWCKGITDYNFLKRYLNVFEEIKVFARVKNIDSIENQKLVRLDGENVEIYSLPFTRTATDYIKNYIVFNKRIDKGIEDVDCAIFRIPSVISSLTYLRFIKTRKPFCAEVVADLSTNYNNTNFFTKLLSSNTKHICKKANGVSYVTKEYLQQIYPCKALVINNKAFFTEYYSSIDLDKNFFGYPKKYQDKNSFVIVHTSNISNTTVKGQDILIKSLGILVKEGYDVSIKFIGDSEIKDYYYRIAKEYNVLDRIVFTGLLSSKNEVRNELLNGDFFVLPTKMEGLPRSIIEAMATGLPCISTPIAGIPELLDEEYMCNQEDYTAFAEKIKYLIDNPLKSEEISKNNIIKATEYCSENLSKRRNSFYKKLYNLVNEQVKK